MQCGIAACRIACGAVCRRRSSLKSRAIARLTMVVMTYRPRSGAVVRLDRGLDARGVIAGCGDEAGRNAQCGTDGLRIATRDVIVLPVECLHVDLHLLSLPYRVRIPQIALD